MKYLKRLFVFCFLMLTLTGCESTDSAEALSTPVIIDNSSPSIVVLGRRHLNHKKTEFDYITCVGENIKERAPALNIIPEQQFINAMYPYFEQRTAPFNINNLKEIAQKPVIAEKFEDLNLRYVVWINGNTRRVNQSGAVSCAIGPGGGGCFGFSSWDEEADYQANIWDIDAFSLSKNFTTERSGTSYLPAVIVPIPLLAKVQDTACNDMARRIEQAINS